MKEKAKQFYNSLYSMPPAENDLERFGKQMVEDFIEKLLENQQTVVWNYGLDSVIFVDKINKIKEDFFEHGNNQGDSSESPRTRTTGDREEDQPLYSADQSSEDT